MNGRIRYSKSTNGLRQMETSSDVILSIWSVASDIPVHFWINLDSSINVCAVHATVLHAMNDCWHLGRGRLLANYFSQNCKIIFFSASTKI